MLCGYIYIYIYIYISLYIYTIIFQYYNEIFRIENMTNWHVVTFRLCQTIKIVLQNNFFKNVNRVTQKFIFNCLRIDLTLFYIEVFVIIQAIIFLYVWPRRVKSKMLIKILNQFIQYSNARFWFKPCGCKVSRWKIQ